MVLTKQMVDEAYSNFAAQVELSRIEQEYIAYKEGFTDGYKTGFSYYSEVIL